MNAKITIHRSLVEVVFFFFFLLQLLDFISEHFPLPFSSYLPTFFSFTDFSFYQSTFFTPFPLFILPTHPVFFLPTQFSSYSTTFLPTYLLSFLPAHIHVYLLLFLPTHPAFPLHAFFSFLPSNFSLLTTFPSTSFLLAHLFSYSSTFVSA